MKHIIVSSLFLGIANIAFAQTLVTPVITDEDTALVSTPVVTATDIAPSDKLTGFYLGASLGFSNERFSTNVDQLHDKKNFGTLSLGISISYLYQFANNFVLGAEFDNTFDIGKAKKSLKNIVYNGSPLKVKRYVYVPSLLATLGYKINSKWMPFIKAGATYLKQEYSFDGILPVDKKGCVPTVGLGVDYRYTTRTNFRLEGLYNFRQKLKYDNSNAKYQRYNIRLAVLYRL